jgi:hypothetical protein
MSHDASDYLRIGPASDENLSAAASKAAHELATAAGGCVKDIVCWREPFVYVVLARVGGEAIPSLRAIDRVNELLRISLPNSVNEVQEVRVLANPSALTAILSNPDHHANSQPLAMMVLANWSEVMVLYYELIDKLMAADKPAFACTVCACALNHNGDFIYDDRFMEAFEAAALLAYDAELPMLRIKAQEAFAVARDRRKSARPLPAIHNGYRCVVYYPVMDAHGSDIALDPPVVHRLPALVNEAECQWEGILLAKSFSKQLPAPDPDIEFFTQAAIESLRFKWGKLTYAECKRLDEFSLRITRKPLSEHLRLKLGPDPNI